MTRDRDCGAESRRYPTAVRWLVVAVGLVSCNSGARSPAEPLARICPGGGAQPGGSGAAAQKSHIGERREPPRVAVRGTRVAQLREDGLALWEGATRGRTDKLERPVSVAWKGADALSLSRPSTGARLCRHPGDGAATCEDVAGGLVAQDTQLAVAGNGDAWIATTDRLHALGPGGKEVARPVGSVWLPDGTVVETAANRIAWTPLGGARHEVAVEACDRRLVAGSPDLLLLAGRLQAPGDEGGESWRAVRIDDRGRVTTIGQLTGHPYDAAPWKDGVAVLRGRRESYGEPVQWDLVLLAPGAAPREERLPIQPRYNLVWDTGFSIAADGDLVAVGNHDRLAVFDAARGRFTITDGPTE